MNLGFERFSFFLSTTIIFLFFYDLFLVRIFDFSSSLSIVLVLYPISLLRNGNICASDSILLDFFQILLEFICYLLLELGVGLRLKSFKLNYVSPIVWSGNRLDWADAYV